jgi:hypothetical protein
MMATNDDQGAKRPPQTKGATCETCGHSMPTALSCTQATVTMPDGISYERLPFMGEDGHEQCPDCGVQLGGFHHIAPSGHGCDVERCPKCGGQYLMCSLTGTCDRSELFKRD